MKFRSKTGEIVNAESYRFCRKNDGRCKECPLFQKISTVIDRGTNADKCNKWVNEHPYEAARLMGYEVVEDDEPRACFNCIGCEIEKNFDPQEGCKNWEKKKEANMDKPRICEVLGVEVGEDVKYRHTDGTEENICVCEDGRVIISSLSRKMSTVAVLINAINHPDRIIRKPHWTEQEVEDAKTIRRVLGADWKRVEREDDGFIVLKFLNTGDDEILCQSLRLESNAFPSVKIGQVYTLDEIIGGAK